MKSSITRKRLYRDMLNVSSMKKMSLNMKSTIGGIGALNNRKEQFKVPKSSQNVKMSLIYVL